MLGTDGDARDGAIREDKNGSDGVDVLLDLTGKALLVGLFLPRTARVGKPWCVEDADLRDRLCILFDVRICQHSPLFRHCL